MSEKNGPEVRDLLGGVVDRRQVLIKLGAFAITAPAIVSCGDEGSGGSETGGGGGAGGSGGTGGSGASTTSASTSAGTGGAGGSGTGTGGTDPGVGGMGGGGDGDALTPPPFDDVPTCRALNKTDGAGQGPFFIHELEKNDDISLFRQDIRGRYNESAPPGVEMHLHTGGWRCISTCACST